MREYLKESLQVKDVKAREVDVVNDRRRTGSERRKNRFRDQWKTDGKRDLESKMNKNTEGHQSDSPVVFKACTRAPGGYTAHK